MEAVLGASDLTSEDDEGEDEEVHVEAPEEADDNPTGKAENILEKITGGKELSQQSPEDIVASIMKMRKERDVRRQRSAANVAKIVQRS